MDVPLALNDIGIRQGLKRYKRKSSTFSHQTDVIGFLYSFVSCFNLMLTEQKFNRENFLKQVSTTTEEITKGISY